MSRGPMAVRAGGSYFLLVLLVLAGAAALRISDPFPLRAVRFIAFDTYQRLQPGAHDVGHPVRIVDIDEESLARIGQWPWPRTTMADLLRRLSGEGAAVVAFDILFPEPDQTSPGRAGGGLPRTGAAGHDEVFADAIAATPTVLAVALTNRVTDGLLPQKAGYATAGDDPRPFVTDFPGVTSNLPEFDAAAAGLGSINWLPDRDQVVRRVPLVYRQGEAFVPALAAEALRVAQGAGTYLLKSSNASGETAFGRRTGLNHIRVGAVEIPTDADGGIWLRFRHSNPSAYIPAWKVLAGDSDPDEVSGRIVLVGTSAPGLIDLRATPLEAAVPGVEIHAQAVEHILSGEVLTRPDYAVAAEIAAAVAVGLLLALLLPRMSAMSSAVAGVFAVGLLFAAAWLAFRHAGMLFDPSYPALSVSAVAGVAGVFVYRRVEKQRAEVRRAFGYYVSPTVVDEIIAHPERLELGGEVRELTLLFCDVRNFTAIAERMQAQELTSFINNLLTPLSRIILDRRGTIDKYMGDSIMAFWNAPLDDGEHADNACRAAVEMVASLDELDRQWRAEAAASGRSYERVRIGIGINTGDCCVGNLGSEQRFDYSAIGDDVNVASRFEGLSKHYGVTIVVGEPTVARMTAPRVLELDLVRVKGKGLPTRVYTLLDAVPGDRAAIDRLLPLHADMLDKYRRRRWNEAEAALRACRAVGIAALENFYSLYRTRIFTHREIPPPADWDGADTAMTK